MATYTVGVASDLHHRTVTDDMTTNLQSAYALWTAEGANAVLFTGDMIDDSTNRADSQAQLAELNAKMTLPTYWAIGNHELQGNLIANFLTDRGSYAPNVTNGTSQNGYFDLGDWRVIYIDGVSGTRFSADATTLTYLEAQLEAARLASKYIVVAMHPLSYAKWPNATSLADTSWTVAPVTTNASSAAVTGNITPSAVSGNITITSSANDFVVGDIGRFIMAMGTDNVWGVCTITAVPDVNHATCTVVTDHEFPNTSAIASGSWGYGTNGAGYSIMAFNADAIRAKIETAVTAGAEVKAVVAGHGHTNGTWTVNDIIYYELPTTHDGVIVGIMHLESDGTFRMAGTKGFISRNYPYYFVSTSGNDTTKAGRMRNDAWATIAKAEATAVTAGDTVTIMAGTYKESLVAFTHANLGAGPPIVFTFESGSLWDANGGSYALGLTATSHYLTFNSLKITGATGSADADPKPAGIYMGLTPSNIVINDLEVYGCGIAGTKGAGIADATTGTGPITFNRPYVHDNLFIGYRGKDAGTKAVINYGLFVNNTTAAISALNDSAMTPTFKNCTITKTAAGTQAYGYRNSVGASPAPVFTNCILYGSGTNDMSNHASGAGTISYSIVGGTPTWGNMTHATGMLTADPKFVSTTDFHLKGGSGAINTGTDVSLTSDYLGKPIRGTVDIGAYEYQGRPSSGRFHRPFGR